PRRITRAPTWPPLPVRSETARASPRRMMGSRGSRIEASGRGPGTVSWRSRSVFYSSSLVAILPRAVLWLPRARSCMVLRGYDPNCSEARRGAVLNISSSCQAVAEHFQQVAEFQPLRNRGLRALAVAVLTSACREAVVAGDRQGFPLIMLPHVNHR